MTWAFHSMVLSGSTTDYMAYGFQEERSRSSQARWGQCLEPHSIISQPLLFVWEVTEIIMFYEVEKYTLLFDQENQGVISEEYVSWGIESEAKTVYNSLMFLQNFQSIVSHGHILTLIYSLDVIPKNLYCLTPIRMKRKLVFNVKLTICYT